MYISVGLLNKQMGVDLEIARFFVDRKVPAGNSFWKDRLLYIGRGNGFVSIPVYYDLLFRLGVSKKSLLAEDHVVLMEQIMHFAILFERNEIDQIQQLTAIEALLKSKNAHFSRELGLYLRQTILKPIGRLGNSITSLNRADVFLYVLCDLPLNEQQLDLAIKYWYPLHSSYLIMDDMGDRKQDEQNGEENCVNQLGGGTEGFDRAMDLYVGNIKMLEALNPQLSEYLMTEIEILEPLRP